MVRHVDLGGPERHPADERALVLSGTPATQRFVLAGTTQEVIGVPLPAVRAAYFEVFSLDELAGTLRALAFALAGAALVTTLAGAAVGRWASSRALRPLAGLTDAAVAIADGQLDTRVEAGDDADLEELASAFNRDDGQPAGPDRARGPVHLRREPRAAVAAHHPGRHGLGARGPPGRAGPPAQRALDLLDGDLRRFTRMVDDLLEISRFDAGSAELSLDEVDPGELVRRAVAAAAPVGEDGVRDRSPSRSRSVPVSRGSACSVDKRRFERVMANLVENATQYAGGVTRVLVERQPGRVARRAPPATAIRVVVEDRGPGVPEAERDHLFERFYRGARAGQRASGEGTGLGLSLVAEHVRLHGGRYGASPPRGEAPASSSSCPSGPTPAPGAGRGCSPPGNSDDPVPGGGPPSLVVAAVALGLAACGIPTAASPTPIAKSRRPLPPAQPAHHDDDRRPESPPAVGVPEQIFLVAPDGHLVAATREVAVPASLTQVVGALLAGPTATESAAGHPVVPQPHRGPGDLGQADRRGDRRLHRPTRSRWWARTRPWPSPRSSTRSPSSRGSPG